MSEFSGIALNLTVNSVLPFLFALGLVLLVLRVFRVPPGATRLGLLLLPFVRLVWGVLAGVPDRSFLWVHLQGVARESGSLQIGLGAKPPLGLDISFLMTVNAAERQHGLSLGDVAVLACNRIASWCGVVVVVSILSVSAALLIRRCVTAFRFARRVNQARRRAPRHVELRSRWRTLDIFEASDDDIDASSPFAGGIVRPYVCLPKGCFASMSERELDAVVAHEAAHIDQLHLIVLGAVGVLVDVFWFVPGVRWLQRAVADTCEHMADDSALKRGADRIALASAMVEVAGRRARIRGRRWQPVLVFGPTPSRLEQRVTRLIDSSDHARPRLGWRWLWMRAIICVATAQTVLMAILLSNRF